MISSPFKSGLTCALIAKVLGMPPESLHIQGPLNDSHLDSAGHRDHYILDMFPGVYVLWEPNSGRCLYVGKVSDQSARKRLKQHLNDPTPDLRDWMADNTLHFCFIPCPEGSPKGQEDYYERLLIEKLEPETNKLRPKNPPHR